MATSKIIFFDLPSKDPNHAWSLNTWKTRLVLNYKGLDYETEWLEYPEIKPRLQPHFPDKEELTVPTVKMPDGTYIMDSWAIAQELEKQYPSPSLHLDSPVREKYIDHLREIFPAIFPLFVLGVPTRLLKEVNMEYWRRTREAYVGMPLEKYVQEGGGETAYKRAGPSLQKMTALLKENTEGPYFLGKTVSYVDFIHAGVLVMFRQLGDDVFQPMLEAAGEPELHLKFLEALQPWLERDNY